MGNVLVTGGAGGIGKAIVKKFVDSGDFVYVVDKDKKNLDELLQEIGECKCKCIQLDVTNVEEIKNISELYGKDWNLSHIVTLAGRALADEWKCFEEQEIFQIHESVNVNLLGQINIIHEFYKHLKDANCDKSIVMVSSINAMSNYGLPGYSAAKSGLYGFMNAVVKEFGRNGVRINTISPGTVVTPATQGEPKDFDSLIEGTAIGRFATPMDIANMVYELCNTFTTVTGQNIVVDAGQSKTHQ